MNERKNVYEEIAALRREISGHGRTAQSNTIAEGVVAHPNGRFSVRWFDRKAKAWRETDPHFTDQHAAALFSQEKNGVRAVRIAPREGDAGDAPAARSAEDVRKQIRDVVEQAQRDEREALHGEAERKHREAAIAEERRQRAEAKEQKREGDSETAVPVQPARPKDPPGLAESHAKELAKLKAEIAEELRELRELENAERPRGKRYVELP